MTPRTFEAGVAAERARIAEWLDQQRGDVPAHGWEFAAALRAETASTPSIDEIKLQAIRTRHALRLMWQFALRLAARHDTGGDDTFTPQDHKDWQQAADMTCLVLNDLPCRPDDASMLDMVIWMVALFPEIGSDEELNGGDAVERLGELIPAAWQAIYRKKERDEAEDFTWSILNADEVEFHPISSAARQWSIDSMPDDAVCVEGIYRLPNHPALSLIASLQAEGFRTTFKAMV
jgi:hypothetical protein